MGRPAAPLFFPFSSFLLLGILSWAPVKGQPAEWVLAALLAAVFLAALRAKPFPQAALPPIPASWFILLVVLAVAMRFIRLTSLAGWPFIDEGDMAWAAVQVMEGKDHGWFFVKSRTPPLYPWMLAGLFKVLGVSLLTIRLLPALMSAATVLLYHPAARVWMGEPQARWASLAAAFSFPFLYFGRLGFAAVSVVPAFLVAAWLLGRWLGPGGEPGNPGRAVLFGCSLGAGFYTYHSWPAAAALFLALAVYLCFRRAGTRAQDTVRARRWLLLCVASAAAVLLPLLTAALREGTASYWAGLGFWRLWSWEQIAVAFSYLRVALWGLGDAYATYKPVWGGFLNPLAGALCLTGWALLLRSGKRVIVLWVLLAHLILILPAALSLGWMPIREALLFPFFPAFLVMGVKAVAGLFHGRWKRLAPVLLLLVSSGLDAFHLLDRYPASFRDRSRWGDYGKNADFAQAYDLLQRERREHGGGMMFLSWTTGRQDLTLRAAVYSFNAADNPRYQAGGAPWAAVLCNVHYRDALKAFLPGGRAFALSGRGGKPPDGGLMLYVAPLTPVEGPRLSLWSQALKSLEPYETARLNHVPGASHREVMDALEKARRAHGGGALLRWFWVEKAEDESFYQCLAEGNKDAGLRAVGFLPEVTGGATAPAHLSYRQGVIWEFLGEEQKAGEAYRRAVRSPLDLTDSRERLRMIGSGNIP